MKIRTGTWNSITSSFAMESCIWTQPTNITVKRRATHTLIIVSHLLSKILKILTNKKNASITMIHHVPTVNLKDILHNIEAEILTCTTILGKDRAEDLHYYLKLDRPLPYTSVESSSVKGTEPRPNKTQKPGCFKWRRSTDYNWLGDKVPSNWVPRIADWMVRKMGN